ncbi:MAG: hypothetical protein GY805_38950 [Chloroflexi bacterium]|nr:hypothetical protein [Chloroflexota bacterium]
MKLICKQCQRPISKEHTNIQEGICFCEDCGEFFSIAPFLRFGDIIEKIEQPDYSEVKFLTKDNAIGFVLPPGGWKKASGLQFIFIFVWSAFAWFGLFHFIESGRDIVEIIIALVLSLAGIGFIVWLLFRLLGTARLLVDKTHVIIAWRLFGLDYTRKGKTADITNVGVDFVYEENYRPVYGVGIKFKDGKYIKFGAFLSEEEKKWIVGEILTFTNSFS